MRPSPHSPRRQRRRMYEADHGERRRRMVVPLSKDLRKRFHARSIAVRKGDTVRVLSGSYAGREERVARINRRDYTITLDNVTLKTTEEKLKALPLRPAHIVITRLNLADPWRRRSLQVADTEVTPEERGEAPEAVPETTEALPAPEATADAAPAEAPPPKSPGRKGSKTAPADAAEESP